MAGKPGRIHRLLLEALRKHPEGLTSGQLRRELALKPEEQAQLDRRRRDLKKWYHIRQSKRGREIVYIYEGERDQPLYTGSVDVKLRAEVLNDAHSQCQMCGQTVRRHGITLVVDHKIPQDWGGTSERENLWAICEDCNQGKKNLFASQDQALMRQVMQHRSVHMRIGELLKAMKGQLVPASLLSLVAAQADWMKRTRELRYLGWVIEVSRRRLPSGREESQYRLRVSTPWPHDPTRTIRDYEVRRAESNRRE